MKFRARSVLGLLVVTVLMAACGGSDGGSKSDAAQPSTTAAATPTGDPIVIASTTSDTGGIGNRQAGDGLAAWANEVNAKGGLLGRPVKIERCDDATDVQKFGECARKVAANDAVLAVAGSQSRYVGVTGGPIFEQAGLAYVCGNPANPDELKAPNTFCITGGFTTGFNAEFAYLASQGIDRVTFITADSAGGHASIGVLQKIATPNGVTLDPIFTSTTSPDYLPAATAAVASKSGAVVAALAPAQTLQMLQALQQAGNKKPILSGESTISAAVVADPSAEGLIVGQAYPSVDTDSAEMRLFKKNMEAIGSGDIIGTGSLGGWLTGRTVQKVIENLGEGNVTRAAILDYLKTKTVSGVPLLPDLALANAPKSVAGMTSVMNPTSSVFQVKSGKFTAIPDSQATLK